MTELTDLSETDASNITITSIDIDEGCAPSGINNAIRNTLGLIRRAFKSSIFRLRDSTDQTKLLAFDLSGLTTATTRTVTMGDANVTLRPQSWELITTQVPAGAGSVVSTGLSAFRMIRVTGYLIPATDDNTLLLRTSTDNGSNYDAGATDYDWQYIRGNGSTASALNSDNDTGILISNNTSVGGDPQEGVSFSFVIHQFNKTTYAFVNGESFSITASGAQLAGTFGGRRKNGTARDAFRLIYSEGGNMTGFVTVEGIRG